MKLWQINVKLRRFLDTIRWPLVTRARFELNRDNYEEEIKLYERHLKESRNFARMLKQEKSELQRLYDLALKRIQKLNVMLADDIKLNYHNVRDSKGRFTKAN